MKIKAASYVSEIEFNAYKNMPVYDVYDLQNVTSPQSTKVFVSDTITVRF